MYLLNEIKRRLEDKNYRIEKDIDGNFFVIPNSEIIKSDLLRDVPVGILYKDGRLENINDFDDLLRSCQKEIKDIVTVVNLN